MSVLLEINMWGIDFEAKEEMLKDQVIIDI